MVPARAVLERLSLEQREQLERILSAPVECVFDPGFGRTGSEARFVGPLPFEVRGASVHVTSGTNEDATTALRSTLTAAQERELFLRFNYCRYRVMRTIRRFSGRRLTITAAREILRWDDEALATRDALVYANLGLVPAMIQRSRITGIDFGDLVGEGQMALLRSVDKFDCGRGFKFSTYACRSVLSSFSRVLSRMARDRDHFPTEFDPEMERSDFLERKRELINDDYVDELKLILAANAANLNNIEQRVIRERFGFDVPVRPDPRPQKTLGQVADVVGVTRERVRQIQNQALSKLRGSLEEAYSAAGSN
ncbi:MAG: RNA polymerase sigma factor RpoD [Phycisphaerae bacterium]|nr:RNA polymerase sigma factor RpoD [Phycisphaerae bacterium]